MERKKNIIYFLRIEWFFIWIKTWIPLTQGCFVPSLVENERVVLEKIFFHFVNVFSLFHYYFPLEKGGAFHLYTLQSPLSKDALC